MNNFYRKVIIYLSCLLLLFVVNNHVSAQCNDIQLSLTGINSTCLSNGEIIVTLSGNDVANIRQSDMQFQVSGTQNHSWTHYAASTISNLPAGTYTISLRAFCNTIGDWIIATSTATITLTSSYTEMQALLGATRKTLNCINSGMIPITIKDGSAPYTITMISYPAGYTGTKIFTATSRGIYQVDDLPAGDYVFTVGDDCSYTRTLPKATVGTMAQDFPNSWFSGYLYPTQTVTENACDVVAFYNPYSSSSYSADEVYYYYTNPNKYFEFAYLVNDFGTKVWQAIPNNSSRIQFTLPSPHTMYSIRDNDYPVIPYVRIKNTTCESVMNATKADTTMYHSTSYFDVGCDSVSVNFTPYSDYDGLFCYPYKWRIIRSDNTVFIDWQGPISNRSTQTARVPYGTKIEYIDSEGYVWRQSLTSSAPTPYLSSSNSGCDSYKLTGDIFNSTMYMYLSNSAIFPAGTRFEYLSGPTVPIHIDTIISSTTSNFNPFATNYSSTSSSVYSSIEPGTYSFRVTMPGCPEKIVSTNHTVKKLITPVSYIEEETCGGLILIPSGQLGSVSISGVISNSPTYFMIYSSSPSDIPFDQTIVQAGDTLFLPATGEYRIGMSYSSSRISCVAIYDTVEYTKTLFSLNPAVTTAHVCEGAGVGFIRVAGMGGSGDYSYELYDNGVLKETNTTGVFNYGTANSAYKIKLIDTDIECAASYEQEVTMIDLGIAQIAYTSSTNNTFCLDDSIYLKCITLGETTYEWSGPGITTVNKNQQNPAIAAEDIGLGFHTYTIKVTPEGCGSEMVQSITLQVEDCSGAQDDYLTLFANTTDSVDILTNDAYASNCAALVVPVITIEPTKGSYMLVNKKVYYTPNTDFTGRDSLTYSTTCAGRVTTAKVYFTVVEHPDNIVEVKCWVDPEAQDWAIHKPDSIGLVSTTVQFLVGDMNDDGFPDIVAAHSPYVPADISDPRKQPDKIKIFYGPDFNTVDSITGINPEAQTSGTIGKIKVSESPDVYETLIFYRDRLTLSLYALRPDGTSPWISNPICDKGMAGLADFNGDGWTEVYVGNKIFDAATGKLLADGGSNNTGKAALMGTYSNYIAYSQAIDILGDTNLELVAGNQIYKVDIDRTTVSPKTLQVISSVTPPSGAGNDGVTIVGDFNNDGKLEVLVRQRQNAATSGNTIHLYLWSPHTGTSTGTLLANITDSHTFFGIPFIGDIDGDGRIEIVTLGSNGNVANQSGFRARKYNESTGQFSLFWDFTHIDQSGGTGMTLFDFNLDGIAEIVYRDEYQLRIINGSKKSHITGVDTIPYTLSSFKSYSATSFEYPVIVDIYGNGSSAILVTSDTGETRTSALQNNYTGEAYVDIFTSDPATPWAAARKVWNQYSYNPVNVNEDLTIPSVPLSIATVFSGKDNVFGTTDDVRPYNNILQQQTTINKSGVPFFIAPDVYPDSSLVSSTVIGNTVRITVGIINQGDAAIGTPVYTTVYKDDVLPANKIATGSYSGYISPGDTGYVMVTIPDITLYLPLLHLKIRVNDDGTNFPYQPECDDTNNVLSILNPAINLMMHKDASLKIVPPVDHNGLYSNPVSVLYSEEIEYKITAVNANEVTGTVIIRDTLPPYLDFKSSVPSVTPTLTTGVPSRDALEWSISGVGSMASTSVTVIATPREGSCSSQPMFINRAWVLVSDTLYVPTNYTYHQGASIGIATFSFGFGGTIYNAWEQALDYRTTPRPGIVIVPDEGYRFIGWSHDAYLSLRNETISAQNHIMHYDTLTIYGNVNLHANFELEEYAVLYHLHGGNNSESNPESYTIQSGRIMLKYPEKKGDEFLGWTGSNGDKPELLVTIPEGSTGSLEYYANYLYSGREEDRLFKVPEEDKIWSSESELYVRTSKIGSIVRVYSVEGVLQHQQTILHAEKTTVSLSRGVYIVTLDNEYGQKVKIE